MFFFVRFNDLIEYDKAPEFIKHIYKEPNKKQLYFKTSYKFSESSNKIKYKNKIINKFNEYKFKQDEEINWIFN